MVFSATLQSVFILSGLYDVWAVSDIAIVFILAAFIAFGHRWAMVSAMVLWTVEKGVQIHDLIALGRFQATIAAIAALIWWTTYMHAFWLAYRVEQSRRAEAGSKRAKEDADNISLSPHSIGALKAARFHWWEMLLVGFAAIFGFLLVAWLGDWPINWVRLLAVFIAAVLLSARAMWRRK